MSSREHSHCSNKQCFIAVLLQQTCEIFGKLLSGWVLEGNSNDGYEVTNPDEFAKLIQESKALVNYTDYFVLKDPSDKMKDIYRISETLTNMDLYDALRYVTGILDSILSTLPKVKIPEKGFKLRTHKQKAAIATAMHYHRDLLEIQRRLDRDRVREEKSESDIGRKRVRM